MRIDVLAGVRPDRLMPTAVRPALHEQGAPGWMPELKAGQWERGRIVGEWKQGKCGWPTDRGSCRNKTMKGTSRCYLHQGDWTKRGRAEIRKRASKGRRK